MIEVLKLYEDKSITNYIQTQFKKIKKHKNEIGTATVLNTLNENIKEKYQMIKLSEDELCIKLDKKKNVDDVKTDIYGMLKDILNVEIDIGLLFNIFVINNELVIRAKRIIR